MGRRSKPVDQNGDYRIMHIRPMIASDIPAIIHLGARMHEESQYSILQFSPEKVSSLCYSILDDPSMLALVAVDNGDIVGMLGGISYEYEYGTDTIAIDRLVYVDPASRGSRAFIMLVKGYLQWAGEQGAAITFLSQTTGINQDVVSNLYKRLGFAPVGGMFAMIGR